MHFCLAKQVCAIIIKKRNNQALSGQGLPVEPVEVRHKATVEAGSPNLFAIAKS